MLKRILNSTTGIRFTVTGVITLFLAFLFMPGNVRNQTEVSSIPYMLFVSGSGLMFTGLIILVGSFALKFFDKPR